jgi:hypothetical protein
MPCRSCDKDQPITIKLLEKHHHITHIQDFYLPIENERPVIYTTHVLNLHKVGRIENIQNPMK